MSRQTWIKHKSQKAQLFAWSFKTQCCLGSGPLSATWWGNPTSFTQCVCKLRSDPTPHTSRNKPGFLLPTRWIKKFIFWVAAFFYFPFKLPSYVFNIYGVGSRKGKKRMMSTRATADNMFLMTYFLVKERGCAQGSWLKQLTHAFIQNVPVSTSWWLLRGSGKQQLKN